MSQARAAGQGSAALEAAPAGAAGITARNMPPEAESALERAVWAGWAGQIWAGDTEVWTTDDDVSGLISNRLGWLEAPQYFAERIDELEAFAAGVRATGFQRAVVCGMGGSSLAPDVLARSFERGRDSMTVEVLDSTDPAAVAAIEGAGDVDRTLYLIATKSGTTSETLSFLEYFWALQDSRHGPIPESLPGDHFVAITDPGKSLQAIPHQDLFRSSFLNPEDVGGRYSALTYVGLVPAALLGVDLRALLGGAAAMAARCQLNGVDNPGLVLGTAMGALARSGRDKLTLLIEPRYASFGAWVEQLIAESTGKNGLGIVPVDAEPLGEPASYGGDRVFVRLSGTSPDEAWATRTATLLEAMAGAGHPVIDLRMLDSEGLGGEFFRWEFATAVAGAVLGINPFDEPNVTESKENTRRVLREFEERGELPHDEPIATTGPLAVYGDSALRLSAGTGGVGEELRRHLERARPSSYVAIQAYIAPSPQRDAALAALRSLIRDRTGLATTVGYGPRFLHSTGQLHKGGPRTGCFLQLTSGHPTDLQIPGAKETFGTLIDAQALGDFASLEGHELPVARIHLSEDPDAGLAELHSILQGATKSPA